MNNQKLSLALNGILAIAVIILFVKVFGSGSTNNTTGNNVVENGNKTPNTEIPVSTTFDGNAKIAYVRNDSIMVHYKFYVKASKQLEGKRAEAEKTLKRKYDHMLNRQKQLSEQAQFMTKSEEQKAMQEMQNLQVDYQNTEQKLMNDLGLEEENLTNKLYDNIENFLDKYTQEHEIDMVLNYVPRMGFLYISPKMDITTDVLRGLNDDYDRVMEPAVEGK